MTDQTRHDESPSRRSFLKHTGAAVAGTAVTPLASRTYAGGDETIRIALIGCGGRGTGATVQALRTEGPVELYAMADAFEDQLKASHKNLAKAGGVSRSPDAGSQKGRMNVPPERQFVGLDAYRKVMALDEIDLVILTTPPGFRPIHFDAAVKAGKHVFMEKPLGTDAPGIQKLLSAAKEADRKGLKVGVGLNRRHSPVYEKTIQRIHDGAVGRIINERIYNMRGGTGKFHKRQKDETELEYQVRHWYYFAWLSGDFITEQSVHDFDVAAWMKGDAYPVAAEGQGGRLVRTGDDYGNIFDHFYVEYDFADGAKLLSQHRHIRNCWNQIGEFADGTKARASVLSKRKAAIQPHGADKPTWEATRQHNSYQLEHDHLFAAIREGRSYNEAYYGARSTMIAIIGRMAAYSGQRLSWDEALKRGKKITTDAEQWDAPAPVQPLSEGGYEIATPGETKVLTS